MYCRSCGNEVNPDLKFCNGCGARIAVDSDADTNGLSETSFHVLIGALLTIPIVGIGLILGLIVVMKEQLAFRDEIVMSVVMLSFLLLIAAEGGIITLLLTRTRKRKQATERDELRKFERSKIVDRILSEGRPLGFPASAASVTDHTTRALDERTR